jgi:pimeloyl-ACP methyl ester carboxylesterase
MPRYAPRLRRTPLASSSNLPRTPSNAAGTAHGNEGFLEDTLAAARSWGFRLDAIRVPVLIVHAAKDKMVPCAHGEWLAARCPAAESRIVPDMGHITVLDSVPEALTWLAARARA